MLTAEMNNDYKDLLILREENEKLRKAIEKRKVIERAKGILMTRNGFSEDEAYRKIQKLSMDKRKKMSEIAEAIIVADEVVK